MPKFRQLPRYRQVGSLRTRFIDGCDVIPFQFFRQLGNSFPAAISWNSACSFRVVNSSQCRPGRRLKGVENFMNPYIIILIVLIVFSIVATGSSAYAVGPYFENESPSRGQFQGPNATWPRPDVPLWSPSSPPIVSRELLKKGEIVFRDPIAPNKAESAPADVINPLAGKDVAHRGRSCLTWSMQKSR